MRTVIALLLIAGMTANCASIAHGTRQDISVQSNPTGADVVVKCAKDAPFNAPPTPTEITLKRNRGGCVITVSKEGYEPRSFRLTRQLSGWYLANILIGGVIGLIIDAADGAMFNLSPKQIVAMLPSAFAPVAVEPSPVAREEKPAAAPAEGAPQGLNEVAKPKPGQPEAENRPAEPPPPAEAPKPPAKVAETAPAEPSRSAPAVEPPSPQTKTSVAQPKTADQPPKEARSTAQVQQSETQQAQKPRVGEQPKYRVQVVRDVKNAWKVLVTNDDQAVVGCKSLKKTSKEYDFNRSFPVRDVQEDAVRAGGNVVLTPTTAGQQPAVIFSCPASP